MRHVLQVGTAQSALPLEPIPAYMRWVLVSINGRLARDGSLCHDSVAVPTRADRIAIEKQHGGTFVGVLLEPTYDRNGYYDPPGGFFWEDEYAVALDRHAEVRCETSRILGYRWRTQRNGLVCE